MLVCFTSAFIFCMNTSRGQTIKIQRQFENDECTMGYISVNDSVICYSLERADFSPFAGVGVQIGFVSEVHQQQERTYG